MNHNIHNDTLMIETVPLQHQNTEVYFNGLSGFGFGNGSISRLQQLKSGELTQENENQAIKQHALYGMLMYTLATSATLTDGTQRVLIRK